MSEHNGGAFAPVLHAATNPYRFGAARGVLAALLSVMLFVGSTGWFVYRDLAGSISGNALDISGLGAQSGSEDTTEEEEAPADSFAGRAINILVVGIDSREDQGSDAYGSTSDVEGIRGDTTMLMHVSADRSRVQIVSIPRDLITDIPACTRTDGSVSGATTGQFNSAITIGANYGYDVASGIACTKATTEKLTGLTVDAFAVVDFKGFQGMINALGGVWFNLDEPVSDSYAQLDLPAGCQRLDGTQALAYARARYELGDGSDISRIGRQQQLVAAIFREALSKNFVTDLPALLSFVKQTLESVQPSTNLSGLNNDAGLLLSVADIDKENIQFVTMPVGAASWDPDRVVATEPMASDLWAALAADGALPVGITYTDGTGAERTVPEPSTAQSGATGSEDPSTTEPAPAETVTPDQGASPEPSVVEEQCPPADDKASGRAVDPTDVWVPVS